MKITLSYLLIGILLGILFTWIISRLKIFFPKVKSDIHKNFLGVRKNYSLSSDARLRNDIYRFTQRQHLSASLFSLDEIAIEPKVLTPLIQGARSTEFAPTDCVNLTVPYIPDWPELASVYKASTLTLVEALQGGANIILAGHPGSGKTVALAWLASHILHNSPGIGVLEGLLPLYVHATDIYNLLKVADYDSTVPSTEESELPGLTDRVDPIIVKLNSDIIEVLIGGITSYVSPMTVTRLPSVVRSSLDQRRAILLVDRDDELPPKQAYVITEYLRQLHEKYPKLRIVVAQSFDNLAGLPTLGFSLLAMAVWSVDDRSNFLQRWSRLWSKYIYSSGKNQLKKVNTYYLKNWLGGTTNTLLNPLEYTLKIWAAYSGDIIGSDGPSAIEAYIRRMIGNMTDVRPGLEHFALQLLTKMVISSNPHDTDRLSPNLEIDPNLTTSNPSADPIDPTPVETIKPQPIKDFTGIETMTNNGFLVSYPGSRIGFTHPIFCGFLAGNALSREEAVTQIQNQPAWTGKTLSMYYLAFSGDVTPLLNNLIQEDDIFHTNHLLIARWLQVAPKNRPWRTIVLRTLTSILQKEKETVSLVAKIISAMALSGDAGVSLFFRQLLKSDHPNLVQMAALGCGILGEKKAITDLSTLLQEDSPSSIRTACVALAAIGDKQSLEILATTLLNGSELMRRYAAEALANNPKEGHPALLEGSSMEDLLVRRSVAFGLVRVNQPWAIKIVEKLQLEDDEWVVRNAAVQAFDEIRRKTNYAPQPMPDLTETQWLIDYAAKIGTTVAPGKPAEELVIKALANGSQEEILNALDYLRFKCDVKTIDYIQAVFKNNSSEVRDSAYFDLWLMTIAGIKLPISFKFNIE